MSIEVRRAGDIFETDGGWFQARWHFSFSHYRDPRRMGVGPLRVFNDDLLVPGAEWPMHPHQDLESLTYVVEGRFGHADSHGGSGELYPGAAQVMTFGRRGVEHSERNLDPHGRMRFLQFSLQPDRDDLDNDLQQHQFTTNERTDRWLAIMSPPGEAGLDLRQDARVSVSRLTESSRLALQVDEGRGGYLYVIDGAVTVVSTQGANELESGDAAVLEGRESLTISGQALATELWVADVPLDAQPKGIWTRGSS